MVLRWVISVLFLVMNRRFFCNGVSLPSYPGGQGSGGQGYQPWYQPGGQGRGRQGYPIPFPGGQAYPGGGQGYYPDGQGGGGQGHYPIPFPGGQAPPGGGGHGYYPGGQRVGGQSYYPIPILGERASSGRQGGGGQDNYPLPSRPLPGRPLPGWPTTGQPLPGRPLPTPGTSLGGVGQGYYPSPARQRGGGQEYGGQGYNPGGQGEGGQEYYPGEQGGGGQGNYPVLFPVGQSSLGSLKPYITKMHITSEVQLRYARTKVECNMSNPHPEAKEVQFSINLTENALIHTFMMETDGNTYFGDVHEKEKAAEIYRNETARSRAAGIISRGETKRVFNIRTNVLGNKHVFFEIVYDERLDMTEGAYVLDVNINLDKEIPDLRFDVLINETIAIKHCSVIQEYLEYQYLEQPSSRSSRKCHIVHSPSTADQTDLLNQGRAGQFSVTYKPLARQMDEFQVVNGYFAHFNAFKDRRGRGSTLPLHVTFVIDVSGSMISEKLDQVKLAMEKILMHDLGSENFFSIITFNNTVKLWQETKEASWANKIAAMIYLEELKAGGGTNLHDAIIAGLRNAHLPGVTATPVLILMTDGYPTVGVRDTETIKNNIKNENQKECGLYTIGFGSDVDMTLLDDLATDTRSFSKHLTLDGLVSIQLEQFYQQLISRPVLAKYKITYYGVTNGHGHTVESVKNLAKNGEALDPNVGLVTDNQTPIRVHITGEDKYGQFEFNRSICHGAMDREDCTNPTTAKPDGQFHSMERFYAYQTIMKLQKKNGKSDRKWENTADYDEVLRLSLKYNFVTELTSLVVTTSNQIISLNDVSATAPRPRSTHRVESDQRFAPDLGNGRNTQESSVEYRQTVQTSICNSGGHCYAVAVPARPQMPQPDPYEVPDFGPEPLPLPSFLETMRPCYSQTSTMTIFSSDDHIRISEDSPALGYPTSALSVTGDQCAVWLVYDNHNYQGPVESFRNDYHPFLVPRTVKSARCVMLPVPLCFVDQPGTGVAPSAPGTIF